MCGVMLVVVFFVVYLESLLDVFFGGGGGWSLDEKNNETDTKCMVLGTGNVWINY